jgi:hypothetical protein
MVGTNHKRGNNYGSLAPPTSGYRHFGKNSSALLPQQHGWGFQRVRDPLVGVVGGEAPRQLVGGS